MSDTFGLIDPAVGIGSFGPGCPGWNHPLFNWDRFKRVTNDGFFLVLEARDPRFSENEAVQLLERTGGQHITAIHED